jgi:hypothetical protein
MPLESKECVPRLLDVGWWNVRMIVARRDTEPRVTLIVLVTIAYVARLFGEVTAPGTISHLPYPPLCSTGRSNCCPTPC